MCLYFLFAASFLLGGPIEPSAALGIQPSLEAWSEWTLLFTGLNRKLLSLQVMGAWSKLLPLRIQPAGEESSEFISFSLALALLSA